MEILNSFINTEAGELPNTWTGKGGHRKLERRTYEWGEVRPTNYLTFLASAYTTEIRTFPSRFDGKQVERKYGSLFMHSDGKTYTRRMNGEVNGIS